MNDLVQLEELDVLRRKGLVLLAASGWFATLVIALLIPSHGGDAVAATIASALINILPTHCARKGQFDSAARIAVGVLAAAQPAFLVFAMSGSPWQIDGHMYFFVGLAMLTILCDVRPVLVAAGLICVHHTVLAFAAPEWVFSGGGGLARVAIHGGAVALQASALCFVASSLNQLFDRLGTARDESTAHSVEAREAQVRAEKALADVEAERQERLEGEKQQEERRRAELLQIAVDFEHSVAGIAQAVSEAAQSLDDAAASLDEVAHATGHEAIEAASSAEQASTAARDVAINIANLARSIDSIAENASRQSGLADNAGQRTNTGDTALAALTKSSHTIGVSIGTIAQIAQNTNILALNATIEAVSAGEAGHGFRVVAQEVKSLAAQSAKATDEITNLLTGIRDGTLEAEESFGEISNAISELMKASAAIQSDTESQRNSAQIIKESADETAQGFNQMAGRIGSLARSAETTGTLSRSVRGSASSLLTQSMQLKEATANFVTHLRAG